MHLKNGAVLQGGRYRIERLLGQGGFGITYMAIQSGLNRKVAIKEFFMKEHCNRDAETSHVSVPSLGSQELVSRFKDKFLKEAATIAAMENDHIVRIHDIFEENGTAYYVMEYLGEDNLQSRIPASGMPYQEAVGYIMQIAAALGYIHSQNILHLDIKPSNVLFRKGTDAVLIDFGVSKHYDGEGGSQTSSTPVGLSRGYAPLEQNKAGGVSQFTPSTDIYALGATFYKLITGQTPPEADEVNEDGLPAFPSSVPSEIASVIEKAMQPKRKDRPQNIDEFLAFLDSSSESVSVNSRTGQVDPDPIVIEPDILEPEPVVDPSEDKTAFENEAVHDTDKPSAPVSESSSQTSQSSPKKKSRKWLKWLLGIISVLFLIGLCAENEEESVSEPTGYHKDHGYVDLGLPSGLKWATCNVGASRPGDYGNYYAWGEMSTKEEYWRSNSDSYESSDSKWNNIGGNSRYDAATANWGGYWRMPTKEDFEELLRECTWEWTTLNGHNGYKVIGPNGNSIFLPAAGWRYGTDEGRVGSGGYYWSSTPDESYANYAYGLCFGGDRHGVDWGLRDRGRSVRPVLE
ncbi:MAG: serine/threonine protein kinase [Bacteroidales bacterium]|nr:serine/threonine protein kinase [Bacteroidales bacterium]